MIWASEMGLRGRSYLAAVGMSVTAGNVWLAAVAVLLTAGNALLAGGGNACRLVYGTSSSSQKRSFKRKTPEDDLENLSGDLENLPSDPADKERILENHPNERDEVRRKYLMKCPCQPRGHKFPHKTIENKLRRFNSSWFHQYGDWLEPKNEYNTRLNASINACRYLLRQGLPFRGHDESVNLTNKGNFLELLKYNAKQNELVSKMLSHKIQTEIVHCFAKEIIESVIQEIDHGVFCLLVDESADVSDKEQIAVVFRFVDKHGIVKENFIGLVHVKETSSLSLKCAVDSFFAKHGLSMNMLRGHGYDEASNMKGEFNGLRALILKENNSAYYVHCFARHLQLVVITIAQKHLEVGNFFDMIVVLLNVVGASCKRKDMVREDHRKRIEEKTKKVRRKRWTDRIKRCQANGLFKYFHTFDFVFYLQLMLLLLGLKNNLSKALQRKDLDILNSMSLLKNNGWESFINKVYSFCENYKTELLVMEDELIDSRKPRTKSNKTIVYHYKVECFFTVLDMQIQEFNDRFDEINTEVLGCIESLSSNDSFLI
ncbi:hypothetical protein EUTSA_v10015352mg, partial [Eutrema salsugineum]